ncbi:putative mitochondrial TFIIF-stimulated CTD phosphatase [Leptomonas pyrrhocoris]|uniref:Mitochondrial import inner membrane translocase subunit TIM50 n=1 Tax=Leptomonas pyrrhocoris TaxID=157538 RepID=A0A0N0DYL5_LEPPY|nr:putative mitochondrial TFIIF-stimulated CTD phosphatase [Leptomonas pyrrhocoris]XP_015662669.1 putative mitochondrial TFIIF-stimulated CTD phosphatase [Leptomonas pyrrhocoris]XP_015662670.1 putative mitochondrial TFIIF-stimulated CTD phosphatase [Leptomonas pyrrhocoris]KPA84229.1 putative mitochondrial TFIIF-stimulated CTD phosphatase [Leptomonas pyrrhocoris]KPA84230.1 putative mitochondrial TFIIF-stimulated CTD phosphatase [Leptomonas pyrrhocoris]KPA84231.1 putative mitochondrial TFIIF-sti|eukprot:XP_015662668.1 putative mitochondrial TFIIF-stimulated CTD phosphatase [Leptomonas pyrrhocoris]
MYRRSFILLAAPSSRVWWSPYGKPDRTGETTGTQPDFGHSGSAPRDLFQRTTRHRQSHYAVSAGGRRVAEPSSSSSPDSSSVASAGAGRKKKSYAEAAAGPLGTAGSAGQQQAMHMYANKENAWEGYTDDCFYGAKRFREYWHRMLADRGVRYYVFTVVVMVMAAGAKLWQMQTAQRAQNGLLGPRKKNYRSRLTVVLDVDETLLSYGDKAFRLKAGLVPRPYLAELLDYLTSIDAEVVLWAACSERYMRQVLGIIDPSGVRVTQYITRDKEWFSKDNYYEKNVLWLKRPLEDTIIIENRPLSVRNCNANAILVDDFIRGEYMDTGQDHPANDHALRTIKNIIEDLETSGMPVPEYLANAKVRNPEIKEIPCHLAIRQLPDEIARGVFYFIGDKMKAKRTNTSS